MIATHLESGDCLFYKGRPMRVLWRQRPNVWACEPIFTEPGPAFDQEFDPHDEVQLLHGSRSQR